MSAEPRSAGARVADRPEGARIKRYLAAEQALWRSYGLEPIERFIEIDSPPARLRVLEVGSGEPVLFVPGTGGTGPYFGGLIRELDGFRCLVLDRPGWGLSSPVDYSKREYKAVVADIMSGVLNALDLDHADVVGASVGSIWALRAAAANPDRVARVVLLGGMPSPEVPMPTFFRLLASPLGIVIVRLGRNPKILRSQLRGLGHGPALEKGRLDSFIAWRLALERDTGSMRSERDMVRALVSGRIWRSGFTVDDADLASIRQPVLHVWGTADPYGSADMWKRLAERLPRGELRLIDGAGHLSWLDDPSEVAHDVGRFLSGARNAPAFTPGAR